MERSTKSTAVLLCLASLGALTFRCSALQGSGCIWGEGGCEGSHSATEGLPRRRRGVWHGSSHLSARVTQPHWGGSTFDWAVAVVVVVAHRWAGRTVAGLCGTSGRRCQCQLTRAPHCRSSFTPGRQVGAELRLKALVQINSNSQRRSVLPLTLEIF